MAKQKAPVQRNETITLQFEDLTHQGNGVGKVDGYPLFVPFALPGEEASVKVVKVNKNFGYGKLIDIHKRSPHREEPPCHVYEKCGGCQLQHMSYDMQLEMKQNQVKNAMQKVAQLPNVPVHKTLGMEDPWRYRNNIQIPVGERDGELITGFYQKRSHTIIDNMKTCVIQDELNDQAVHVVREIVNKYGIKAYDEKAHTGALRHIVARSGKATGELMVILITRTEQLAHIEKIIEEIREQLPHITSIMQNINPNKTNVIYGKDTHVLWGASYIHDRIEDLTFAISARSFYQVNPRQTEVLYNKALEYAQIKNTDIVIDAFCGIGTISLFLARKAKKVYGVEIVPEAISDAKKNAKMNNLTNTEFVVGAAEKVMPWWKAQGLNPDVIVVDPPRKGCDETFLQAMIAMEPTRIVYVSCNPSTLARDLRILEDGGYETQEVQPVDMFSQTGHVETITLLQQKII